MARKIVAIHGIGNAQPGWSELLRVDLDIPKEDWIEFYYDDLMDRSLVNRFIVIVTKTLLRRTYGPEEYIDDIITYFLMDGSRLAIQTRLKEILQEHSDAILLSHSLGSVVAYETLQNFQLTAHTFFCFGSPLSKALVRKLLKVPVKYRPNVFNWFNIWSPYDLISGQIEELACRKKDQFRIQNSHNLLRYVHSQKKRILQIYAENQDKGKAL